MKKVLLVTVTVIFTILIFIPVSCKFAKYHVPQYESNTGCRIHLFSINIKLPWCERIKKDISYPTPGTWSEICRLK